MSKDYAQQTRGGSESYAQYYAGMDKSMRQKVALISAYLPAHGTIADMGSGSGSGSHDLACLYPELKIVGVDISETAVDYSRKKYQRKNLSYTVGDIAKRVFPDQSLSSILNSSVLHHVTSFNGFSTEALQSLLDIQHAQLEQYGVIAIRDFLIPDWPEEILFDIPEPISLFESFCKDFECSLFKKGCFHAQEISHPRKGWRRFRLPKRVAIEYVLRKDYLDDWDVELLEEYLYFTQSQFESELSKRGFQILVSRPIYNPWILRNRFIGKFHCYDLGGTDLGLPPTNYFIAARKQTHRKSYRCMEISRKALSSGSFLKLSTVQNKRNGQRWNLAERPQDTFDFLIYARTDAGLQTLLRQNYPRPLTCLMESHGLDLSQTDGFVAEAISASLAATTSQEDVQQMLLSRSGVSKANLGKFRVGIEYLASPGGLLERIHCVLQEVNSAENTPAPLDNHGLGLEQDLRWVGVDQLLRANQVGGLMSARSELAIYNLALAENLSLGPWIGTDVQIPEHSKSLPPIKNSASLMEYGKAQQIFESSQQHAQYLESNLSKFRVPADPTDGELELEWICPREYSSSTLSLLPVLKQKGRIYIGLELRELPALAYAFDLLRSPSLPAWRLPKNIAGHRFNALAWTKSKAEEEFQLQIEDMEELGTSFHVSAGTTPEKVSLFLAYLKDLDHQTSKLSWVEITDLLKNYAALKNGQLLIGLFRLAHALNLIK